MAGDWIKMRTDLSDDPAVIGIAASLDVSEDLVVGKLHRLWSWADRQSRDGHATSVTKKWIDRYMQCDGFADAMISVRWLAVENDGISFPNFDRHNGETAKTRAQSSKRQKKHREIVTPDVTHVSRSERDKSVTREEKRREEEKEQKKKQPQAAMPEIPDWVDPEAWAGFDAMRRKERHPLTPRAAALVLRELAKHRAAGTDPNAVLDQSTRNGWRDVFALRPEGASNAPQPKLSPIERIRANAAASRAGG